MTNAADHFRTVADGMSRRVDAVPADGWDADSPCDDWKARDIIRHLSEWVPWFIQNGTGDELDELPSVDDDPARTWAGLRDQLQQILDAPGMEERTFESEMFGTLPLGTAIQRFVTGDVLIHTWDLARSCGLDESLDADAVSHMYAGMKPMAGQLSKSGQFDEPVEVPDDADDQTKLLALSGRRP